MKRRSFLSAALAALPLSAAGVDDSDEPVTPPPAGATVLFNGQDLSAWVSVKTGAAPAWKVENGFFEIVLDTGDIRTRDEYRDFQLHLEFRIPDEPGRSRGNSGVYLQGKYEVQIIDSFGRAALEKNGCGALYLEAAPLRNASKRPGLWQSLDIAFRAPRYDDAELKEKGVLTVFHNRVLVQNNTPIPGMTGAAKRNPANDPRRPGPIVIQNHGSPVRFRNIWLCNLST
jgi:hypothetical protein